MVDTDINGDFSASSSDPRLIVFMWHTHTFFFWEKVNPHDF